MQSGQANAVCTNKAVVEKMIKDAYQDAEVVATSATGEEYAIVVSKDNPRAHQGAERSAQEAQGERHDRRTHRQVALSFYDRPSPAACWGGFFI